MQKYNNKYQYNLYQILCDSAVGSLNDLFGDVESTINFGLTLVIVTIARNVFLMARVLCLRVMDKESECWTTNKTMNILLIVAFGQLIGAYSYSFNSRLALSGVKLLPKSQTVSNDQFSVLSRSSYNDRSNDLIKLFSTTNTDLVGEDAGAFDLAQQKLSSWAQFLVAVSGVLGVLFYAWLYEGGPHLGDQFKDLVESFANGDSTLAIVYMLGFFAVCHSGLASLRPYAEEIVGARVWRYVFALVSLPLAFSSIVYFINHRYDGIQLWDLRLTPGMHEFVYITSILSFFFLYPSTFNLLEVAAVDKPQLHLWETGITRITRHPQMVGQLMWCAAHTAYIGSSFMVATSFMLCAHHIFAVWNGDRRLKDKHGDRFELVKERTSVVPFQAIWEGRQKLPDDYHKELLRPPYFIILGGSIIAFYAHPFMQAGAALVHW